MINLNANKLVFKTNLKIQDIQRLLMWMAKANNPQIQILRIASQRMHPKMK